MKKGWTYKKLGEVTTFQNGFAFKSSLFRKDGLPIVRISSIQDEMIKEDDLVSFYPSDYDANFDNYKILPNDILIAMSGGTTGKLGINRSNKVFYQNQRVGVIRENKKVLNHLFLYYFLHTKSEESLKIAAGAAQPNLSTAQIKAFVIPLPSLEEQQAIVSRLDAAFAQIDALKANAEKALGEAKALFQASLKEMLEPKEGWEEKKLEDITEVKDGTHDSPKYATEGIPFVTQKNITINGFDLLNTKKITLEDHKRFYARSNVEFGDIIIAMIGANRGMSCIVDTREVFSIKNVGLIKKSDNINSKYLLFYLHSPAANAYVLNNSNGGAQEFIGLKGLRNFPIQYPPLSEQHSIVATLDSLKSKVDSLQENYEKISKECDALKQAMLREIFE